MGEIWENTSISKLRSFLNSSLEAEIYAVPKTWGKCISIVRKNMGKHKHFKVMGFLNISGEVEIHASPKLWEN